MLFNPGARFDLARRLRAGEAVPLGEVFRFLSGLYFRGKLAYAAHFTGLERTLVITPNRGLIPASTPVTLEELAAFGTVAIDPADPLYRLPLEESVLALAAAAGSDAAFVLLGSLASAKYVEVLRGLLPGRLRFPVDFQGRGDMSRGALLLRCVALGRELEYAPLETLAVKARRRRSVPDAPAS